MTDVVPRKKPEILCTATNRWGGPCQRPPIRGGTVCATHGGRAPQVKARARQRLDEASDKAAFALVQMLQDETIPPAVRLGAVKDLLDRAGLNGTQKVEVTARTWEDVLDGVLVDVEDPNVVDAVIVEDDPAVEERRDEDSRQREVERVARQRKGGSGAARPSEQKARDRAADAERAFNAEKEAFLLNKLADPPQTGRRPGKRVRRP